MPGYVSLGYGTQTVFRRRKRRHRRVSETSKHICLSSYPYPSRQKKEGCALSVWVDTIYVRKQRVLLRASNGRSRPACPAFSVRHKSTRTLRPVSYRRHTIITSKNVGQNLWRSSCPTDWLTEPVVVDQLLSRRQYTFASVRNRPEIYNSSSDSKFKLVGCQKINKYVHRLNFSKYLAL